MRNCFHLLIFCMLCGINASAQQGVYKQLQKLKGISIATKQHADFKEYYEIMVEQPLDHFSNTGEIFKQRIYIGINDADAPTVIETQGYAIGNTVKPTYMPNCNVINVEHRYYGKSLPDSMDWTYLTIKQAAYDCHHVRQLLGKVLKGKWMSTGISKGGQMAVAYKMYFPNDVDAVLAHVTPIKNGVNDDRLGQYLHNVQMTECGAKVYALQKFIFNNKPTFLNAFNRMVLSDFDNETVLDYMLLEYPFAFFQNCASCDSIPDTTAAAYQILGDMMRVVPPRFYSKSFKPSLEPSFYMFYHELGYYEYDLAPYKQWLKNDSYANNTFAPDVPIVFDSTYLHQLNKFIGTPAADNIIFVYGEMDPYTALRANSKHVFIVSNGCHKSRVQELSAKQKGEVFSLLSTWLNYEVGY